MENIFIDFIETLGFLLFSALEIIAKNIVNISSHRREFDYGEQSQLQSTLRRRENGG